MPGLDLIGDFTQLTTSIVVHLFCASSGHLDGLLVHTQSYTIMIMLPTSSRVQKQKCIEKTFGMDLQDHNQLRRNSLKKNTHQSHGWQHGFKQLPQIIYCINLYVHAVTDTSHVCCKTLA